MTDRVPPHGAIPLRWQLTPDGRSRGSVSQYVRDLLAERPEGLTAAELERLCRARFGPSFPHATRSFRDTLSRLVNRGEAAGEEGKLKAANARRLRRSR